MIAGQLVVVRAEGVPMVVVVVVVVAVVVLGCEGAQVLLLRVLAGQRVGTVRRLVVVVRA